MRLTVELGVFAVATTCAGACTPAASSLHAGPDGSAFSGAPSPAECAALEGFRDEVALGVEVADAVVDVSQRIRGVLFTERANALRASTEPLAAWEQASCVDAEADHTWLHGQLAALERVDGVAVADGTVALWPVLVDADPAWGTADLLLPDLTPATLGVDALDLATPMGAHAALPALDGALVATSAARAGAQIDREVLEVHHKGLEADLEACGAAPEPLPPAPAHIGDDAGQLAQLDTLLGNVDDGDAVVDLIGGAVQTTRPILLEIESLAVWSASETLNDDDRAHIQDTFRELEGELSRIARRTEYAGQKLTDGSGATADVQTADGPHWEDHVVVNLPDLRTHVLGVDTASVDLSTAAGGQAALANIDVAVDTVDGYATDNRAARELLAIERQILDRMRTYVTE